MSSSPLPPSTPPPAPRGDRLSAGRVLSHVAVMLAVSAVLGVIVAGLAIPFAGVLSVGARNAAEAMDDLPEALDTETLPQRTQILDSQGDVMATIYDQNRVEVSLDQISRTMIEAIVAIEDYRFYEHGALDLKGTLRAFLTNAANEGTVQGGSSITQQLVKQTLVTQAATKKERQEATANDYARKLRELRYAIAMEEEHTKDWILERYLNIAYFGDGAYGIQAAAKHYFNVNARKLDLRQSAMLAGMVQSPDALDPTDKENRDRTLTRRNVVLDRLAGLNVITQEKADEVKDKPLGLRVQPKSNGCTSATAPFFCDYVLNYLMDDPSLGKTEKEREKLLRSGGLTIKTTLDLRFQRAADEAVEEAVYPEADAIGGLAMVEPGTGEVRAVAQSRPMGRDRAKGETFLNYAVNQKYGDSAGFQPGSTFKVFVLAAALEKGLPLTTSFNAQEQMEIPEESFEDCDGEPYGYGVWSVGNSTKSGYMNMYTGTRLSVNTYFAQLEQETGICEPFRLAKEMGVDLTSPAADKNGLGAERVPSFTLGIADASPLEMAEAYATFGARGLHCDSRPVTSIEDHKGNVLKDYKPRCTQVIQETTADAINDILSGVLDSGGFASAENLGRDAGGKTGTTQVGKAVWFAGYTPTMATAAMIAGANQSGTPMPLAGVDIGPQTIGEVSGSGLAAPIWGSAMRAVLPFIDDEDFVYPEVEGAGVTSVAPPPSSGDDGGGRGNGGGRGGRGGR